MADLLVELLDPDAERAVRVGGYAYTSRQPAGLLVGMLSDIVGMLNAGTPTQDPRPYVCALHALVLDLVDLTGAPTTGRRHPAHTALVQRLDDMAMWLADGARIEARRG